MNSREDSSAHMFAKSEFASVLNARTFAFLKFSGSETFAVSRSNDEFTKTATILLPSGETNAVPAVLSKSFAPESSILLKSGRMNRL